MKKKLLNLSLTGTVLLVLFRLDFLEAYIFENFRRSSLTHSLEFIHNILLIFPIVFFFSLSTYKAPERIFAAWWKFTRVALPSIFVLTILINLKLHHSPGGWINMDADVDRAAFVLMYAIFILGSLVQIIRGYRKKV